MHDLHNRMEDSHTHKSSPAVIPDFSFCHDDDEAEHDAQNDLWVGEANGITCQSNRAESRAEQTNQRFCLGFNPGMTIQSSDNGAMQVSDMAPSNEQFDGREPWEDIVLKMKQNLPEYVVNCFLAAGYDTKEEIAKIDNNSTDGIESYVNEQFPGQESFIYFGTNACKIPPGHRKRILTFIHSLKNNGLKKSNSSKPPGLKRKKNACMR